MGCYGYREIYSVLLKWRRIADVVWCSKVVEEYFLDRGRVPQALAGRCLRGVYDSIFAVGYISLDRIGYINLIVIIGYFYSGRS